jgi:hypothetical protein
VTRAQHCSFTFGGTVNEQLGQKMRTPASDLASQLAQAPSLEQCDVVSAMKNDLGARVASPLVIGPWLFSQWTAQGPHGGRGRFCFVVP